MTEYQEDFRQFPEEFSLPCRQTGSALMGESPDYADLGALVCPRISRGTPEGMGIRRPRSGGISVDAVTLGLSHVLPAIKEAAPTLQYLCSSAGFMSFLLGWPSKLRAAQKLYSLPLESREDVEAAIQQSKGHVVPFIKLVAYGYTPFIAAQGLAMLAGHASVLWAWGIATAVTSVNLLVTTRTAGLSQAAICRIKHAAEKHGIEWNSEHDQKFNLRKIFRDALDAAVWEIHSRSGRLQADADFNSAEDDAASRPAA